MRSVDDKDTECGLIIIVVVKEEETQKNIERDLKERKSQPVLIFVCWLDSHKDTLIESFFKCGSLVIVRKVTVIWIIVCNFIEKIF